MNKRTTIYILFKEYPDPFGRDKSAPYIQDSADYLDLQDALMDDWTAIHEVLAYFNYEPANKYYDEDNLAGLLEVPLMFPNEYPMVAETIMAEMKTEGLTSWRTNPSEKTDTYFLGEENVTNHLLGDMAQREADRHAVIQNIEQDMNNSLLPQEKEYDSCILLQNGAIAIVHGSIQITSRKGVLMLTTADSIVSMHNWLSNNRFPVRHYVFNSKHGDANNKAQYYTDRHGHLLRAAQLLTDTPATENLLKKAVGESVEGDLWYFDETNMCYIYFENQGETPQHEYHAYHLHEGDKNYDKIDIIKLEKVL